MRVCLKPSSDRDWDRVTGVFETVVCGAGRSELTVQLNWGETRHACNN